MSHENNLKCSTCDYEAANSRGLSIHISRIHKAVFQCTMCNTQFATQITLNKHVAKKHSKKKYDLSTQALALKEEIIQLKAENELNAIKIKIAEQKVKVMEESKNEVISFMKELLKKANSKAITEVIEYVTNNNISIEFKKDDDLTI